MTSHDRWSTIKQDIAHVVKEESAPELHRPEICFAIGDYKKQSYCLSQGFQELKAVIAEHMENLPYRRS